MAGTATLVSEVPSGYRLTDKGAELILTTRRADVDTWRKLWQRTTLV
jgi:hypothetical protein